MKSLLNGTATLAGLIIGVGIFGVPYVAARAGLATGIFWIVVVGGLVLTIHLLYGELVMATPGKHRLPGYMARLFGNSGRKIVVVVDMVRFWGLQIAYLIVGGTFLQLLLGRYLGGSPVMYSMVLFAGVALATFFGIKKLGGIEAVLTGLLIVVMLLIVGRALPHIQTAGFGMGSMSNFFAPYGVVMVSLAGAAAIPEVWDVVKRKKAVFRGSIILGTAIPILLTILFTVAVVGVSGHATSPEAISGLQPVLGEGVVLLGAFAGFLAVITSYFVIALYLQEMLQYDFLVKKIPAWAFSVGVPVLLFAAGAQNFIKVIDIVGSVLFGIEGILIIMASAVVMKRKHIRHAELKVLLGIFVGLLLALGVAQKLLHL